MADLAASSINSRNRFQTVVNFEPNNSADRPKLSHEITYFLSMQGEAGYLSYFYSPDELLNLPVVIAPAYDDSLPLAYYFVSTSHNTYLLGDQLWGSASTSSYTHVITNGAHCVEIDVWPGKGDGAEPIVTHGWTLTRDIPFRDVCSAINDAVEARTDDWPLFVSLECHVPVDGQQALVNIMKEMWSDKLVASAVEGVDETSVAPRELKGKIVMMIEYYPQKQDEGIGISESEEASESQKVPTVKISESLAELGVYARSMKPGKNWLKQELEKLHILINISESALIGLLPHALADLISNGQRYLRRVYPRGSRILSGNLDPLRCWRAGAHFVALNWQDFDLGMQLNEALFAGSGGWVPKPPSLLGGRKAEGRVGLSLDIIGLSSFPHPGDERDFSLRVRVYLYHAAGDREWKSKSVRCKKVPDTGADAMFNERCVWAFDADDLAFLRVVVTEGGDEPLAVFCARMHYIQQGYRFIRLLNMEGKDTLSTLLIKTAITDVS
ncbi:PLC-like phosphodiesterase [Phellopilus nigrolimitatus]|nr:PLC-like phosphodiesterase [Phellopilus nigrolimitatus]